MGGGMFGVWKKGGMDWQTEGVEDGGGGRSHDSRKNSAKRDSNEPSNQRALKSNFRRRR